MTDAACRGPGATHYACPCQLARMARLEAALRALLGVQSPCRDCLPVRVPGTWWNARLGLFFCDAHRAQRDDGPTWQECAVAPTIRRAFAALDGDDEKGET